jgi:hypothetical protein
MNVDTPTRIQLGTKTDNFLDVGSTGNLFIEPFESQITVYDSNDEKSIFAIGKGKIGYESNNIYFTQQSYLYENNGVLIEQDGYGTVKTGPVLDIVKEEITSNLTISTSIVHLVGNPDTLGGSKSQIVQTKLIAAESNEYEWNDPMNITIEIDTLFPDAWVKYYNDLFINNTNLDSSNFDLSISVGGDSVLIKFFKVSYLNIEIAVIDTEIG